MKLAALTLACYAFQRDNVVLQSASSAVAKSLDQLRFALGNIVLELALFAGQRWNFISSSILACKLILSTS
jgi:hypothetical protein